MAMQLIITNLEQIPDDLPPGRYCCRLESMTWQEMKVRFVPGSQHQPGDCLIQLTKEDPEPLTDVPMVCTLCRKPVKQVPGRWAAFVWEHESAGDQQACLVAPIMAMVAAGNENVPRC